MISKAQLRFIKSLHQKKYRYQHRLFLAEGLKTVSEFLTAQFHIESIYILDHKLDSFKNEHVKLLKNTEIFSITQSELERISALHTPSDIIAIIHFPDVELTALFDKTYYNTNLTLVLDDVKDPGNLGTMIRIADWFGIKRVICSEKTVELYNPKVVQATMGSLARIEVFYTVLSSFFSEMKGINVYGALLEGENVYKTTLAKDGFLLMGSESHGIDKELSLFITHPITIPSFGSAESLNVAVAAGILCSEFYRR